MTMIDDLDQPALTLMRMTESLGENCELGFWQRHRGYEASSLFRWAIASIDSLLAFLDAPVPLYAMQELSVHSPGMVKEARFDFKFHSKLIERSQEDTLRLLSDVEAFVAVHKKETDKIAHLQAKFFTHLKERETLYIIKDNKGLSEVKTRAVLAHLHRYNPKHHLLWVEADGPPALVDLGSGLLRGSVPSFAPYIKADAYAEGGWTGLLHMASRLKTIETLIANREE